MGGQSGAERRGSGGRGRDAGAGERTHGIKTRPNNSKMKQAKRGRAEKEVKESRLRREAQRREESEERREGSGLSKCDARVPATDGMRNIWPGHHGCCVIGKGGWAKT